jgi:hypothetical protein
LIQTIDSISISLDLKPSGIFNGPRYHATAGLFIPFLIKDLMRFWLFGDRLGREFAKLQHSSCPETMISRL